MLRKKICVQHQCFFFPMILFCIFVGCFWSSVKGWDDIVRYVVNPMLNVLRLNTQTGVNVMSTVQWRPAVIHMTPAGCGCGWSLHFITQKMMLISIWFVDTWAGYSNYSQISWAGVSFFLNIQQDFSARLAILLTRMGSRMLESWIDWLMRIFNMITCKEIAGMKHMKKTSWYNPIQLSVTINCQVFEDWDSTGFMTSLLNPQLHGIFMLFYPCLSFITRSRPSWKPS